MASILAGARRHKRTSVFAAASLALIATAPIANAQGGNGIWQGLYLGGHAGYAFGEGNTDGWLGGPHLGYNFQRGSFVFGIEGDYDWTGVKRTRTESWASFGTTYTMTSGWQLDSLATLRIRLGYAFDKSMVYVTGGAALARHSSEWSTTISGAINYSGGGKDKWDPEYGYAAGVGFEHRLADRFSARVEGLYYGFDGTGWGVVRVGLSWHPF